nr:short transient receptor potential channel 3-like [Biomphalaria glabrata]
MVEAMKRGKGWTPDGYDFVDSTHFIDANFDDIMKNLKPSAIPTIFQVILNVENVNFRLLYLSLHLFEEPTGNANYTDEKISFTITLHFYCPNSLLETTGTLFWAVFGMGNSQAPAIKEETNSSQVNGDSEIRDSVLLKVIEVVGYVLYGVYILDAVVVLINLFIAMMNLKTFRFVSCYVNH